MITREQFDEAVASKRAAEAIINEFCRQEAYAFTQRWERFEKQAEYFTDADLIYAATCRCSKCGAGMAYPIGAGPWHQWTCSRVLKGIGADKGHDALPFQFYEVKSEGQPSAGMSTTRPSTEPIAP